MSRALQAWEAEQAEVLDRLEESHAQLGGSNRGRRYFLDHLNHAYVMAVASHFQRFCRDLHSEVVDTLVGAYALMEPVLKSLAAGRKLDHGNAQPASIGSDFGRFGLQFWPTAIAREARTAVRQVQLEELNKWRNAIGHQDFGLVGGAHIYLTLGKVRGWRRSCNGLARTFDGVMQAHLQHFVPGGFPW